MFYGSTFHDTRQIFFSSWRKYIKKEPLLALEQQVVDVIIDHPEYHSLLERTEPCTQAYFPEMGESNPFLHMGLHLALRDQIHSNRPQGIQTLFQQLERRYPQALMAEHLMIEQLAECLWLAQRNQRLPDEISYLKALQNLLTT